MLISVVPIGNSRGIRIPKAVLDQLNIKETLELEIEDKKLILKPASGKPRESWEMAFAEMKANNQDVLLIQDESTEEAFEWEW
jgi:antitoxin MazE